MIDIKCMFLFLNKKTLMLYLKAERDERDRKEREDKKKLQREQRDREREEDKRKQELNELK